MEVFDGSVSSQAMEVVVEICTLILSNETNNEFLAPSKKIKKIWDGKLEMIWLSCFGQNRPIFRGEVVF